MPDIFDVYAKEMREIKMPPMKLKKKKNFEVRKMGLSIAIAFCLAFALLLHSLYTPNYTLTVYAMGSSVELQQGETIFLSLEEHLETEMISSSEGSNYSLCTFLFAVGCEEAKTIKYTIVGEQTYKERYHMYDSQLWFAEKEELSLKDVQTPSPHNPLYPYIYCEWQEAGAFFAYRYFGSEYSVLMDDIRNCPCRLAVRVEDVGDEYIFEDVTIVVDIELHNGRIVKKELLLYLDKELSKRNGEICMAIREK